MLKKILLTISLSVLLLAMLVHAPPSQAEYGDVVLNKHSEKNGVRPVVFPHWFHRIRYQCKACHTETDFKMRAGTTEMQMVDIIGGKLCGKCHNGSIAWAVDRCDLCHSGRPGLATGVIGGNTTAGPGRF